jgi:tetratricopeptide (TPR) repeat protein
VTDRRPLFAALALVVVTVAAYLPVLGNGFVNYDDDLYVTGVAEVREGLSSPGVAWAFTTFQGANWFPLTRLSWMLDAELYGLEPAGFHATSLLLHLLAALLLYAALRRLTGVWLPSLAVAAVFALHPLHVESVAWVAARKDVLSGVAFMAALYAYARQVEGPHALRWGSCVFVLLAAGLMAKPMLVTLPCVLLLLDAWPLGRLGDGKGQLVPARLARAVVEKLPLFALAAVMSAITIVAQREGGALQELERFPLPVRLETAVDAVVIYIAKSVWPGGLAVFHPHPEGGLPPWRTALGALLLLGVSVAAWRVRRQAPWWGVGWLWFLGMLVPVLGLVQVGEAAFAERYTYLPQTGLVLALAWGVHRGVANRPARRNAVLVASGLGLAVLALLTHLQARVWRDDRTLFEHALRVTRENHVAHINLAVALIPENELEEAARHLGEAARVAPGSAHAWGVRGEVRLLQERPAEAAEDLALAVALAPEEIRWRLGLARAHRDAGELAQASVQLRAALSRDPTRADLHALLGLVLAERGQHEAALAALDAALRLDGSRAEVHAHRAAQLEALGREVEAVDAWRATLAHGVRSVGALNNLAWLLAAGRDPRLRDPEEAIVLADEAVRLSGGRDPNVLDTLATAQAAAGRHAAARITAARALEAAERRGNHALARSLRRRFALD